MNDEMGNVVSEALVPDHSTGAIALLSLPSKILESLEQLQTSTKTNITKYFFIEKSYSTSQVEPLWSRSSTQ